MLVMNVYLSMIIDSVKPIVLCPIFFFFLSGSRLCHYNSLNLSQHSLFLRAILVYDSSNDLFTQ